MNRRLALGVAALLALGIAAAGAWALYGASRSARSGHGGGDREERLARRAERADRVIEHSLAVAKAARDPLPATDGRARMAAMLEAIRVDPQLRAHRYAVDVELERLRAQTPPEAPAELAEYLMLRGEAALNSGEVEAARTDLDALAEVQRRHPEVMDRSRVLHAQAITALRGGELANCQARHGPESCLFPLSGGGVHVDRAGAQAAAALYLQLLEADPDDLAARWLLNICHQAIGDYPEGVPERFRVAADARESARPVPRFANVAKEAGVDVFGLSGGVVLDDLDGDLDLDLAVSEFGRDEPLHILINRGDGTFDDRTAGAGVEGLNGGLNLIGGDYDNDGDVDIFVPRGAWLREHGSVPNSLLRNRGDGTFEDVTEAAGVLSQRATQAAVFADLDGDGWLDLFVGNERMGGPRGTPAELYLNNQNGTFREVSEEAGLSRPANVKGVTAVDYDNDGDMDLFLSCYRQPNRLMRNEGGGGPGRAPTFVDVAAQAGVLKPDWSFATWSFDYDNDGLQDLWVSSYGTDMRVVAASHLGLPVTESLPALFRNRGDGTFEDVTEAAGAAVPMLIMGANYGDFDGDGWLDMYLGTGNPAFASLVPNRLLRNTGGEGKPGFEDVTISAGVGHLQKGHAVAFGDVDEDGDEDIYIVLGGAFVSDKFNNALFSNPGPVGGRLRLRLQGTRANRGGIGARVAVHATTPRGPRVIHRVLSTGGSFGSGPARLVVGLGDATEVTAVDIVWPGSGTTQSLGPLPVGSSWLVVEGDGVHPWDTPAAAP